MSYRVLINGGSNGRGDGALGISYQLRSDRPCYPSFQAGRDYWWLTDELHESIGCPYSISYYDPHWIIDIEDVDRAILFKLMWGSK
jgi:hypothetical protein